MNDLDILFLLPVSGFGGAEIHSFELAKKLKNQGHNISFCFNFSEENKKLFVSAFEAGFSLYNLPIHLFDHRDIQSSVNRQCDSASDFLNSKKFDLVIIPAPNPFMSLGLIEACTKSNIPNIVIFHLVRMNTNVSDAIRTRFLNAISPSTRLVSVSDFCKDALSYNFKIPSNQIEVIENGVILQKLDKGFSKIKEALGVVNKRLIITPGRFHPQKSWDTFIEAIPLILEKHQDVHFLWCGDGDMVSQLKLRAKELGIERYISIIGFIKFPYKLYAHADLVVLPTRFEAFSLRLLEAMSSGVPIITTDASYQDRVIKHMDNGLIALTDSIESLADNVNYALSNPFEMKEMGANAKKSSTLYTPDRMYSSYFKLINNLISSKADDHCNNVEVFSTVEVDCNTGSLMLENVKVDLVDFFNLKTCDTHQKSSKKIRLILNNYVKNSVTIIFNIRNVRDIYREMMHELSSQKPLAGDIVNSFYCAALEKLTENSIKNLETVDYLFESIICSGGVKSKVFLGLLRNISIFSNEARERVIYKFCSLKMLDASGNNNYFEFLKSVESEKSYSDFWNNGACFYYSYIGKPEFGKFLAPAKSDQKVAILFASHFNYPLRNGSDQRIYSFVEKYHLKGFKVVLVTFHGNGQRDRRLISGLKNKFDCDVKIIYQNRVQIDNYKDAFHSLKDGNFDIHKFYDEKLLLEFYNICNVYKPELVHINYFYFGWLSLASQPSNKVKLVLDTHDLISKRRAVFDKLRTISAGIPTQTSQINLEKILDSSNQALEFKLDDSELDFYNSFDQVIFISKLEMSILCSRLSGTESLFLPYRPKFVEIERKQTLANSRTRALFMGSNNALNIMGAALIEKIAQRISGLYDFEFRVVGDICNSMSNIDGINKGYFVDDLILEYSACDFTVCPIPFGTGQNIKITESLALGIPVIAHSGVAYSANIINGVNGLVFSTVQEFYETLVRLHSDTIFMQEIKESCKIWALEYFGE
ncbi:glycosyltransferase [Aliiglaciecola lipolytica]|uniref:glycosyltransferase n=1 Tax=Aliiglaciecola lipolytica TaxID=477689 RepID=UPI001C08D763|nr:glycosyltransferase [Aliiglaciecola lipolytica]MBU2877759.1 glycosyltransferase [Aliiglaciecola lipolytica]